MAVAIRKSGFNNIKIYNGGINDWIKSELPLNSIEKIPDYPVKFIESEELYNLIREADATGCLDEQGEPILSIIDIRDRSLDNIISADKLTIKTKCKIYNFIIDDIRISDKREILPQGKWIIFCESGLRGAYLAKYMCGLGKNDIFVIKGGFLNWKKKGFLTDPKK